MIWNNFFNNNNNLINKWKEQDGCYYVKDTRATASCNSGDIVLTELIY